MLFQTGFFRVNLVRLQNLKQTHENAFKKDYTFQVGLICEITGV